MDDDVICAQGEEYIMCSLVNKNGEQRLENSVSVSLFVFLSNYT